MRCQLTYHQLDLYKLTLRCRLLGLGFCGEDIGRDQMPGWFDGSWAYHGDDGKLFIGQGRGEALTPDFGASGKFGAGDVVGTCLNLETGEGFCILNGKGLNMGELPTIQ